MDELTIVAFICPFVTVTLASEIVKLVLVIVTVDPVQSVGKVPAVHEETFTLRVNVFDENTLLNISAVRLINKLLIYLQNAINKIIRT